MAVKSGFFNSSVSTAADGSKVYDREYYAADFANYLAKVVGNGVFATPSDNLQVLASSGMQVVVKAGEGRIDGYWVVNEIDYTLDIATADVILNRIDRIVMQLNHDERTINIIYKTGELSTTPVAPELIRTEEIKEYSLAKISVPANATTITQAMIIDTRPLEDECGLIATMGQMESNNYFIQMQEFVNNFIQTKSDEYNTWEEAQQAAFNAWFESVKEEIQATSLYREYSAVYNNAVVGEQVITIPTSINYIHNSLDVLNVYINGTKLIKDVQYSINASGTQITLTNALTQAYQDIEFINKKCVNDAAAEDITLRVETLESQISNLETPTYIATGSDDNIAISNMVKNFLNGTGEYSGLGDTASMKVAIVGNLGISTLIEGQMMFDFNVEASNRRIILDFSNAAINVPASPETMQDTFAVFSQTFQTTILNAQVVIETGYNARVMYGVHGGSIENSRITLTGTDNTETMYGTYDTQNIYNSEVQVAATSGNSHGVYQTNRLQNSSVGASTNTGTAIPVTMDYGFLIGNSILGDNNNIADGVINYANDIMTF